MLAVLNRRFDTNLLRAIGNDKLHAQTKVGEVPVSDDWGIIARASCIESWKSNPPSFNGRQRFFPLEQICERFGRDRFNSLAVNMLKSEDYYTDWIENGV